MTNKPPEQPAGARRWLPTLAAISCTVWVISNIAAIKPLQIPGLRFITMDGGNLLFPISYILGDVLVEVYGYAQARRVIWLGVLLNLFAAGTFALVSALPPADGWHMQDAFATILRQTPRVALGSLIAFTCGSFLNAWVMARMKILHRGRHLWKRTIGSTIIGEAADSLLFTTIAFLGIWPRHIVLQVILWNFLFKTAYEIAATPLTYLIINRLKRTEGSDPYDTHTSFSPFRHNAP